MKFIDLIKMNLKYIFAIVVFFFIFFQVRSCINERKLYDSLSLLKGQIQEKEESLIEKDKELIEVKKAHKEKIVKLNAKIDSSNSVIVKLEKKIVGKDEDLTAIRKSWANLPSKCQDKLHELDSKWTEKFNLVQDKIAEKDRIIFLTNEKYEVERKLRIETESSRDSWKMQAQDLKQLNFGLESKYKKAKFSGSVKTILIGVAIGCIGYVTLAK